MYGAKFAITEQDGWLLRSAAITQAFTATSGEALATDLLAAYVFGWEFENRWRLNSSMRYGTEHGPGDAFNQWVPSIVPGYGQESGRPKSKEAGFHHHCVKPFDIDALGKALRARS